MGEVTATAGSGPSSALGNFLKAGISEMNGNKQAASSYMRRAVTSIDFAARTPVRSEGHWTVFVEPCLSFGWVSSVQETQIIVFGPDTWEALQIAPAIYKQVIIDLQGASSGLKMLSGDIQGKLSAMQSMTVGAADDEVTRLEKVARELMLESASLNSKTVISAFEMTEYSMRSSKLLEAYNALAARMDALGALVDSTTDAVTDALADANVTL